MRKKHHRIVCFLVPSLSIYFFLKFSPPPTLALSLPLFILSLPLTWASRAVGRRGEATAGKAGSSETSRPGERCAGC